MSTRRYAYLEGFYERVDEACRKSGLTKTEIARRAGFERRTLTPKADNWMMTLANAARLCAVTRTDANWLLGIKERNMDKYDTMFINKEDSLLLMERLAKAVHNNTEDKVVFVDMSDIRGGLFQSLEGKVT